MSRAFHIFTASMVLLLLTACSLANGGGPPADVAHYCLAMPAGSGVGWSDLDVPISSLLQTIQKPGAHQTWEKSAGGYIYHITGTDPLTHKTHEIGFEFSDAGLQQGPTCGPRRLGVARMLADGQELTGWDLINMIPSLITAPPQAASSSPAPQPTPSVQPPVATPQLASSNPNPRQFPASDSGPSAPATSNQADGGSGASLSPTYRACMASGDAAAGVTVAILDCAGAETKLQDQRLNFAYKTVMGRLTPDQQSQLRTSERDWIKSRDSTCKAAMGDEAEGTLGAVIYAQCILKQEAARVAYLTTYRVPAAASNATATPTMGACHMDSCAWSKVLSRTVTAAPGGSVHLVKLLGGSTKAVDQNAAHIVWNPQPHTVSVTCSLTRPSVTAFGETDTLGLNAHGSDVPNAQMSAYSIYAVECHPEAKNLDPDTLAKRFNYQAAVQ